MPFYNYLKYEFNKTEQQFVSERILKLKKQLLEEVPQKDSEGHLLLGTWNIRDFDKTSRRGFGRRTKDSLYYIAEIISAFDIVAVQEVNELGEWERVMDILGPSWDYIANDVADNRAGGNGERMVFVYDTRKVWFKNIAGEIVLPSSLLISKSEMTITGEKLFSGKQFRRTPYSVSFQSGWLKFDLCTVHIYFGKGQEGMNQRIEEIERIAKYLSDRVDKAGTKEKKATILLGDFNIKHPEHKTMEALLNNGFKIPKNIRASNVKEDKFYDQIAFKSKDELIEFIDNDSDTNSGVFKVMQSVFTNSNEDFEFYKKELLKSSNSKKPENSTVEGLRKYYKTWRTYQMSDHNLMWVRLQTNDSVQYLKGLAKGSL